MRVLSTFRKPAHHAPMERVDALTAVHGLGIVGDVSAHRASPRQILLTSESVYLQLGLAPGDLRENVIVDADVERFQSGQLIRIGPHAVVRITYACEPCFRLNEVRPLLAKKVHGRRGMLGRILANGVIQPGDSIEVLSSTLPEIPVAPRERLYAFINRIPRGRVSSYVDAVRTLGFPRTYARIMPRFLREAPHTVPVHRMISESGRLISEHVPMQCETLIREGIHITSSATVGKTYRWNAHEFFADEWLNGYYPAVSI